VGTKTAQEYVDTHPTWSSELKMLRKILLKSELQETIKWGIPVYTLDGKNVVGIAGFKNHYGLWFYQGVFLSDHKKLLTNAQEGKTKGMRQMKFFSGDKLDKGIIYQYVKEATENQRQGKMIKPAPKTLAMPVQLKQVLEEDGSLKACFQKLTRGKQREYMEYIHGAKMEKTKISRIKKIVPMILENKGLNDKYKK